MKRMAVLWFAVAVIVTVILATIYAAVQHDLRMSANDPQIQLAEDATRRLDAGAEPTSLLPEEPTDVAKSLAPFMIIYDKSGAVVASSARLDGKRPELPISLLRNMTPTREARVTWQPKSGVRLAAVVVPAHNGYVLSGRSLREVEYRIQDIELLVVGTWIVAMAGLLFCYVVMVGHKSGR